MKKCFCRESMWAVFADLRQAVERINRVLLDEKVKLWFERYNNALIAAEERFKITQSKCCCERVDTLKDPK